VGPDDIIVKQSYENSFQQLATISDPRYTSSPDPTDPLGNTTTFEYDLRDNPRRVFNPDGTSRTLTYDPSGNLTDAVDEEGLCVSRTYDALNRLTEMR
jgi:YD repeat-containing protein